MRIHKTFRREDLEKLPSDELDRMLHEALGEETKDAKLILALMRILEEREADAFKPDVDEAWQTFVERYNTPIVPEPTPRRKCPYRWIGTVAAVIAVFFLVSFGIPKVAGYDNIFTLIASWTDDFFTLLEPGKEPVQQEYVFKTDNPGLQQVYDAVVELGITDPVVPMWIPEGYELVELDTTPIADGIKVYVRFVGEDTEIMFSYKLYYEYQNFQTQKDEGSVAECEVDGILYHFIPNNEYLSVVWKKGNAECVLTTGLNENTVTAIIQSISGGNIE